MRLGGEGGVVEVAVREYWCLGLLRLLSGCLLGGFPLKTHLNDGVVWVVHGVAASDRRWVDPRGQLRNRESLGTAVILSRVSCGCLGHGLCLRSCILE